MLVDIRLENKKPIVKDALEYVQRDSGITTVSAMVLNLCAYNPS